MKKSTIISTLLLFCFLAFHPVSAKENSYEELMETSEKGSDTEKIEALNKLSSMMLKDDLQQSEAYAKKALELARQRSQDGQLALACDNMGMIYLERYDYTNAMKQFVESLKIRDALQDQHGIATSKNLIGKVFFLQEDMNSALTNLNTALEIRKTINDQEGAADTHENLGSVYLFKKLYGKARESYTRAMELYIQLDQLSEAARLAGQLGKIARDMGDHEGALAYYYQSLDLNNNLNDVESVGVDYTNIALSFLDQAKTSAFDREELLEEALEANESAFRVRNSIGDQLSLAETNQVFGSIYSQMNNKKKARTYLAESSRLLQKVGMEPGTQMVYQKIAEAYDNMGDYQDAYRNQIAYTKSRDVIYNNEKSKALLDLTTKYESEFAAEQQKQIIATLENEKAFNTKMRYFMMALLGLGVLLLAVMFYSYRRKQRDNQLLRAKNEEINRQKSEIDAKNDELEEKNASLDVLNQKLVKEMAERESIEQSSFARDRFLATMSHEMRTPMNIIIGLTHLLLAENPRKDQIEHLRTLQFSANNLVVFINDVLDYSKIEAGKLTLESREFRVRATLEEIEKRFILPARDKKLDLVCHFDLKVPELLMGDPARLNQILSNLVDNAIKHTDKGAVAVDVKLNELTKNEATLLISVEDTGCGIPAEKINDIFQRHTDQQSDGEFEGYASSGLGLAITKRLVDLQNGKIEVESIVDRGTIFNIYLPYKLAEDKRKGAQKKTVKAGPKSYDHLEGNTILLVEDNKINQLVVAKMLRKLGMEVITADDGIEALDAFGQQYFDLVLMDIQMPRMDGYRATAEIRKSSDPRKRDVPIIALTASAFLTEREKAKLFGMNDHVGKPFGPDDLLDKISNCLAVYKV